LPCVSPGPRIRFSAAWCSTSRASDFCEHCGATLHVCDHRFHRIHILRRVERARQLLKTRTELSLAEVAAHAGSSDQSQFSHHFKRLIGVTLGQFRTRVRTA
jgi:AraC family transcriptional regulator